MVERDFEGFETVPGICSQLTGLKRGLVGFAMKSSGFHFCKFS